MTDSSEAWKVIFALYREGCELSAQEALDLEKHIQESPDDLEVRAKLSGYYSQRWMNKAEHARGSVCVETSKSIGLPEAYFVHALYFIEHVPDSDYIMVCTNSIHRPLDPEAYEKARAIWMRHIDSNRDNAKLLWNAARHFFMIEEPSVAEKLLLRGKELEPENPEWPDALSHFYSLGRRWRERDDASAKALVEMESAIALKGSEVEGNDFAVAAQRAFTAEDFAKAKSYAKRAIETSTGKYRSPALHFGHTVLGRLAVIDGNLDIAKEHLLASGDVEKYPTLSSFGPTMTLAKELLEAGEHEAVLAYFQRCSKFWELGFDRLEEWADAVRAGRIPDFRSSHRD